MRRGALVIVAMLCATLGPGPARSDGLLEGINLSEEVTTSLLSTRTTDAEGTTTESRILDVVSRSTARLNANLLPKLNLNTGAAYEGTFSHVSGDVAAGDTTISRFWPYAWVTLTDPVLGLALGYDRSDETVKTDDQRAASLTRDTYTANLTWRPLGLPTTQVRYTRTTTADDPRVAVDTVQNQIYLKSEYLYRGLAAYYAGTYLTLDDDIHRSESRQMTHEGKLAYTASFFDGRVAVASDNRIRYSELTTETSPGGTGVTTSLALPLPAAAGLSSLDDTPLDEPLTSNAALIDGDLTTAAGINIGFPGPGGDFRRRNVGLDLGSPATLNRLHVWVDGFGPGALPADIVGAFAWEIYTSSDNLNWSLHATIPVATFGPFDRRFELNFPAVTTRYIKAVTRPLLGGVIGTTNSALFPTIFVTEVQGFADRGTAGAGGTTRRTTQTFRTHNLDLRVLLLRAPSLYYRFNGDYQQFDPDGQTRYTISNGLFVNHRLHPILTASANASVEVGQEGDDQRTAVLYYGSLSATPLRTLTDSLVVSGNQQWLGRDTSSTTSAVLYNTAQLYRGLDAVLNLGAVFTSEDEADRRTDRRELYVNVGTGITPHPSLTLTTYYLGKLTHVSEDTGGGPADRTEHRLDLGLSFTPFRTLVVTAAATVSAATGERTTVLQNYGLSWAPFPDGNLQLSLFYAENRPAPDVSSRIIQPTLRWYFTPRRRSYVEATYQFNVSEASSIRTESQLFSTKLSVYF